MRRRGIGLRIHSDRLDPHLAARAHDADRNLAAIGNQNAMKHRSSKSKAERGKPEESETLAFPFRHSAFTLQCHHIRNTPGSVSGIGALRAAARARPRTWRVSVGSMMPSSHRRAVE